MIKLNYIIGQQKNSKGNYEVSISIVAREPMETEHIEKEPEEGMTISKVFPNFKRIVSKVDNEEKAKEKIAYELNYFISNIRNIIRNLYSINDKFPKSKINNNFLYMYDGKIVGGYSKSLKQFILSFTEKEFIKLFEGRFEGALYWDNDLKAICSKPIEIVKKIVPEGKYIGFDCRMITDNDSSIENDHKLQKAIMDSKKNNKIVIEDGQIVKDKTNKYIEPIDPEES